MIRWCFDLDNTLVYTNGSDYENSAPIPEAIEKVREYIAKPSEELTFIKELNKENIFAGWISYPEISIIETICNIGINLLAIDMEHTSISLEQAKDVIRTTQGMHVPCLPRPVSHSMDITKPLLDFGSDGMIYPMVENPNQVENIIPSEETEPEKNTGIYLEPIS